MYMCAWTTNNNTHTQKEENFDWGKKTNEESKQCLKKRKLIINPCEQNKTKTEKISLLKT